MLLQILHALFLFTAAAASTAAAWRCWTNSYALRVIECRLNGRLGSLASVEARLEALEAEVQLLRRYLLAVAPTLDPTATPPPDPS